MAAYCWVDGLKSPAGSAPGPTSMWELYLLSVNGCHYREFQNTHTMQATDVTHRSFRSTHNCRLNGVRSNVPNDAKPRAVTDVTKSSVQPLQQRPACVAADGRWRAFTRNAKSGAPSCCSVHLLIHTWRPLASTNITLVSRHLRVVCTRIYFDAAFFQFYC